LFNYIYQNEKDYFPIEMQQLLSLSERKQAYFKKKGPGIIDDLQDLNTLEPDLDTYLYIWHEGEYFCSVCHSKKVCYFLKKSQGQNKSLLFSIADFIAF